MNPAVMHALRRQQARRGAPVHAARRAVVSNPLVDPPAVSRRRFIQTSTRAAAAGAVLGSGLWWPGPLQARASDAPLPIPTGSPLLGGGFHIYGPGFPDFDPPDAEPSSITDFNGFVGLAYISGTVVRTNHVTHEKVELPYLFNDMRFMDGTYRAFDGRMHQGTFGFV